MKKMKKSDTPEHGYTAIFIAPVIRKGKEVEVQLDGPDEKTNEWSVRLRKKDCGSEHFAYCPTEYEALYMADSMEKDLGVFTEAIPWKAKE